jgi:hypothetical protein
VSLHVHLLQMIQKRCDIHKSKHILFFINFPFNDILLFIIIFIISVYLIVILCYWIIILPVWELEGPNISEMFHICYISSLRFKKIEETPRHSQNVEKLFVHCSDYKHFPFSVRLKLLRPHKVPTTYVIIIDCPHDNHPLSNFTLLSFRCPVLIVLIVGATQAT